MYLSTRGNYEKVTASQAIRLGMVPNGGLFVPQELPALSQEEIISFRDASYQELASHIFSLYLDDFTFEEIEKAISRAYNTYSFDHEHITPLRKIDYSTYFLELWHGPTAAFKDIALQVMPLLLQDALVHLGVQKEMLILVATSGDTGKAALEGFKNLPKFRIVVFYPYGGVSKLQERQMTTTDGHNTYVIGVRGNFDDCQNAAKKIFGHNELIEHLSKGGYELSSANSINWGRLLPHIVYYFWSYLCLLQEGAVAPGEKINFVVPTGNFGNILAGFYAWKMGLPVDKFICASNENNVLTEFFRTGVYDRNRELILTRSPSMDILISSNLERFLFEICARDAEQVNYWMQLLQQEGRFTLDTSIRETVEQKFFADYATEEETLRAIEEVYSTYGYTMDPHTAVGHEVYQKFLRSSGSTAKTIIASTASPYKFCSSVLEALKGREYIEGKDEFDLVKELSAISGTPIHPSLKELERKKVLHERVCSKEEIELKLREILDLRER